MIETKIAALVVVYNPDFGVVERLRPLLPQLSLLCVVDNSVESCQRLFDEAFGGEDKYRYIRNSNQGGIAGALNRGMELSASLGAAWVLTLDQDSEASPVMLEELLAVRDLLQERRVAIVTPVHYLVPGQLVDEGGRFEKVIRAMTSGNLLRVAAFQETGPFREELFIDSVDYDFCLRLQLNGYEIIRANRAILIHHLGKMEVNSLLGRPFHTSNHPPLRRYYITRNRLEVAFKYRKDFPVFFRWELKNFIKEFLGVLFFEKQKSKKLMMVFRGVRDFLLGRSGEVSFDK